MANLLIPSPYRYYTGGDSVLEVQSHSVGRALEELLARYPDLKPHILNRRGDLHPFINLFVNNIHIRDLQGLDTSLQADDMLRIVPSIAGGFKFSISSRKVSKPAADPDSIPDLKAITVVGSTRLKS